MVYIKATGGEDFSFIKITKERGGQGQEAANNTPKVKAPRLAHGPDFISEVWLIADVCTCVYCPAKLQAGSGSDRDHTPL